MWRQSYADGLKTAKNHERHLISNSNSKHKYNDGNGNTDMIIGLNYKPEKGLTMTPNIRISTPEEGDSTTMFMLNFEFKF